MRRSNMSVKRVRNQNDLDQMTAEHHAKPVKPRDEASILYRLLFTAYPAYRSVGGKREAADDLANAST